MHRKALISVITFLALLIGTSAIAEIPKPLATVRKLPAGVSAEKAVWAQPPTVARFYFSKLSKQAWQRAQVRLAYDDNNLYAAFKLFDSGSGKKKPGEITPEGEIVPDNDSASFMLDTDNDGRTYVMFSATAVAEKSAEKGRQFIRSPLNVDWTAKSAKSGDTWTTFMTIPFKSLGVPTPKPGTVWGAQLSRLDPAVKWPMFWARVRKDPREIQRGGQIMFAGASQATAQLSDLDVLVPGPQKMFINVSNPTGKPAKLKVALTSDQEPLATVNVSAKPGESAIPVGFNYPSDGWHDLVVTVTDSAGKPIAKSPPIPVRLAEYASRTAHYSKVVYALQPKAAAAVDEKKQVLASLTSLAARVGGSIGNRAKWQALAPEVDAAEKATNHLRSLCADESGLGYSVGTESALTKIMRDKLFEGQFGKAAKVELARNEFESTQVAVLAYGKALKNVSVSVSDLKGQNGSLPASAVAINLIDFVQTGDPPYEVPYIGWYPDPVMDYKPFDLAQGGIRPVWLTVRTPKDAAPGVYRGTVTIKPENAPEAIVPLEVRVWNFELPTAGHLKTAFAFFDGGYGQWYGKGMSDAQRKQALQMLLEHRLNPTNIYSQEPRPELQDMPFAVENGLNAFTLKCIGGNKSERARAEILTEMREQEKALKDKGWWDKAYIYGFDELPSSKYPDLRDMYGWVKQQFPDIPRASTVLPNPELKGYVDIWVPLIANFDYEESQQYIKDGDEVWWYVCCGPERPFPNFFVDYPATDPRVIFWMNWKYHVPGFLYWTINRWKSQWENRSPDILKELDAGKRWPELPWKAQTGASFNGDGHLTYPGPDGDLLSSVRLESIRDGLDDYEYFYLLDTLVKKAETNPKADKALLGKAKALLNVPESVVKDRTEFTKDAQVLLDGRRQVAETIEALSKQ